jgi:hypothetical protein
MIDIQAPSDFLPSEADRQISEELTSILMAEGLNSPSPFNLNNHTFRMRSVPIDALLVTNSYSWIVGYSEAIPVPCCSRSCTNKIP